MKREFRNRRDFDRHIGKIKNSRKRKEKRITELKEDIERLRKIESFYRGLMRTHGSLPKDNDDRPQFFFQDNSGVPTLVEEFMIPTSETLLPDMKRISLSEAGKSQMKNRKNGFIIFVSPFNDTSAGHKRFLVDFENETSEIYEEEEEEQITIS